VAVLCNFQIRMDFTFDTSGKHFVHYHVFFTSELFTYAGVGGDDDDDYDYKCAVLVCPKRRIISVDVWRDNITDRILGLGKAYFCR